MTWRKQKFRLQSWILFFFAHLSDGYQMKTQTIDNDPSKLERAFLNLWITAPVGTVKWKQGWKKWVAENFARTQYISSSLSFKIQFSLIILKHRHTNCAFLSMTFPSYLTIQLGYQPGNDGKSCLKSRVPLQSDGKRQSKQQLGLGRSLTCYTVTFESFP